MLLLPGMSERLMLVWTFMMAGAVYSNSLAHNTEKGSSDLSRAICFPKVPAHGNWCGPCHTGQSSKTRCKDRLDCACRAHDLCYRRFYTDYCLCDISFVKRLKKISGFKASLFRLIFALKNCEARGCRTCYGRGRRRVCNRVGRCSRGKKCIQIKIPRSSFKRNYC